MADDNFGPTPLRAKRVAMLVALPAGVWDRIRSEARELGVGPSKLIEPVLLQAFGYEREPEK
jgi:hypothetical protein